MILFIGGCSQMSGKSSTFGEDLDFLRKHTEVIVLTGTPGKAQLAIAPEYQGRVMTSTAEGPGGLSFGWINRQRINSEKIEPHFNVFGGEERFWIGPEGGQFSIYFPKGAPFDFEHWQVPAVIDTEPFDVVSKESGEARFVKKTSLTNWSGTTFEIRIDRTIRLLDKTEAADKIGTPLNDSVSVVAYETESKITNVGENEWKKETGLLSIWILSMFTPSPGTTVVIPFNKGDEKTLGPKVNDEYFGKVPAERLIVKDDMLFFKADGKHRSKIGLSAKRAKPILGSYDEKNRVLTLVQYTKPENATDYLDNSWKIQEKPYSGDAINSYNDGPLKDGSQLGPFYELETLSPALSLKPNERGTHIHSVFHFVGPQKELDRISKATLGVGIKKISNAM